MVAPRFRARGKSETQKESGTRGALSHVRIPWFCTTFAVNKNDGGSGLTLAANAWSTSWAWLLSSQPLSVSSFRVRQYHAERTSWGDSRGKSGKMSCPCLFRLGRGACPEAAAEPAVAGEEAAAEGPLPPSVLPLPLPFTTAVAAGVVPPLVLGAFLETTCFSSAFRLGGILMPVSAVGFETQEWG